MKKHLIFAMNALGWLMLMLALIFGAVRDVGLNPQLYFDLQMEAGILQEAGISREDLMQLDTGLARYLGGKQDDLDYQIEVFGRLQSAFNARELQHMEDCRRLFAPVVSFWMNIGLAVLGTYLALRGRHRSGLDGRRYVLGVWLASALILLPLGLLAVWAAADFSSAFTFFHELLFTNDLWLLNPEIDLLIRICPQSMFMNMGLGIALRAAAVLLGLPLLLTILSFFDERKRKQYETADL